MEGFQVRGRKSCAECIQFPHPLGAKQDARSTQLFRSCSRSRSRRSCGYQSARRATGSARWRMGTGGLQRLALWRGVRKHTGVGATGTGHCRRHGTRRRFAVVRRHTVLRQTQFVAVHFTAPARFGSRLCGFRRSLWRRRGRGQLRNRDSAKAQRAQREGQGAQGISCGGHGACSHTCAGRPAEREAASSAGGLTLRCRAILPALMSSYQISWCSWAQPSFT